jgi:hypothetical protein
MAEFEDALGGTFPDFLSKLPRVVTREHDGRLVFQVRLDSGCSVFVWGGVVLGWCGKGQQAAAAATRSCCVRTHDALGCPPLSAPADHP